MQHTIVVSINSAWNIYNFRSGLIKALVSQGYEVIALTPHDDYSHLLPELGCKHINLPMDNNGAHPGRDLLLLARYFFLLRSIRPSAFLGYTVKPNVYGSIAAQALGIPVINNIAGLGSTFINRTFLTKIVQGLYRYSLKRSERIFFQNPDDQDMFIGSSIVRKEISHLVPGSGIDLNRFFPAPRPQLAGRGFRFLLVARMLKDKGVAEFVEAARIVRQRIPLVEFQLLGFVDAANANSIAMEQIRMWEKEGVVTYLGRTDDVRPYLTCADCVVLPSYREGVPRSLLEAAAMARPVIATDVPGCREAVDDGVTGFLCQARSGKDLAEKMRKMIEFTPQQRQLMGEFGRRKVELEFDEQLVIRKYLQALSCAIKDTEAEAPMEAVVRQGLPSEYLEVFAAAGVAYASRQRNTPTGH
jgi:glycosyltransferase involved in cell wall biosynthesis